MHKEQGQWTPAPKPVEPPYTPPPPEAAPLPPMPPPAPPSCPPFGPDMGEPMPIPVVCPPCGPEMGMELARAYIPIQRLCSVFDCMEALERGTLFPELYRPYDC